MVQILNYSDKAIALFGDTKKFKDELKTIGRFNPYLTNPITKERQSGWIFSKNKQSLIENIINNIKPVFLAHPPSSDVIDSIINKPIKNEIKPIKVDKLINEYKFDFIINNENLAINYIDALKNNGLSHIDNSIAEGLQFITNESFCNVSDKNNITFSIAKNYLRSGGKSLDQVAQNCSEIAGIEINEQQIVDFILKFPKKEYQKRSEQAVNIANCYKSLTGKEINANVAKKIVQTYADVRATLYQNNETNPGYNSETNPF